MPVSKDDLHRLIDQIDDSVELEFIYQLINAIIDRDNCGHRKSPVIDLTKYRKNVRAKASPEALQELQNAIQDQAKQDHTSSQDVLNEFREETWQERNIKKDPLWNFSLKPELIHEDDGSFTLAVNVLTLYANGKTTNEAKTDLIEQLKVYSEEYLSNIKLYRNSSNRKHHLPFVLRVALCDSDEDLEKLLDI